jgi:predicted DNA-binding transcriptional regulator YafY
MPLNKDFALRIELLDQCLRNRLRNWSLDDLLDTINEKLEDQYGKKISKRTLQGDIKFLIEEKEAPIRKRKVGAKSFFYYSETDYSIKNIPVSEDEISRLREVVSILTEVNDFKILDDVNEIIKKLQSTINTNITGSAALIQFEKHTMALGSEYIDPVFTAIRLKTPLRITYQSFRAQNPEEYVFHPYLLKEYRNRWFTIGRKENSAFETNLALDRIKKIRNSNDTFIENDLFTVETYFSNLIGVTFPMGEPLQTIELKCSATIAPYIRTKPIHHTQQIIKTYQNGALDISLNLIINYELKAVLLGYGEDIEVIKPLNLRSEIKNKHLQAVERYK